MFPSAGSGGLPAWSSSLSGLPISIAGSSPVPAISSSSLSPFSSPTRGASGASKGLPEIGNDVGSESFCGDAEDVLRSRVTGASGAAVALEWIS